jgi:alkanesulfonate monooxygenase SsuD/methylene tetrahydromethanopterin reductase-like flavin-dependent oxidoreductase (luciferase family)
MSNIFGVAALTALAVAGSQVPGIELGTAVVPTYPRHPAVLAQQALTVSLALGGRLALGIGPSHRIVIEYLSILLPLLDGEKAAFEGETMRANIGLSVPRPAARCPLLAPPERRSAWWMPDESAPAQTSGPSIRRNAHHGYRRHYAPRTHHAASYSGSGSCSASLAGSAMAPEECTVAPPTTVRAAEIDGMSLTGTVK